MSYSKHKTRWNKREIEQFTADCMQLSEFEDPFTYMPGEGLWPISDVRKGVILRMQHHDAILEGIAKLKLGSIEQKERSIPTGLTR